jgi:hypothetical protein
MPRIKNNKNNFSWMSDKKISLEDLPLKTMKVTIYALRWVFLLIFFFIIIGICILFLTGGQSYIQLILGYSIAGFFTFFMGYFGWILAQAMIEMITGNKEKVEKSLSYYLSKKNKHKF